MLEGQVRAMFTLDGDYTWWIHRAYLPGAHIPRGTYILSTHDDGTVRGLVDVRKTRWARLMASEGFTGDCLPGDYQLILEDGWPPMLQPVPVHA